jgi:hypothetical protein
MQINRYLRTIEYGVTEGSEFLWKCYGNDAWCISSTNTNAVFDRKTGVLYEIALDIEDENLHFRWVNPDFVKTYVKESKSKGFDPWQAYDDVRYTQIKDDQSMFEILIAKAA